MQWLKNLSGQVQEIYSESEKTFSGYQRTTGLNCIEGCGKCCLGSEISATILEMIPTALHLHSTSKAFEVFDMLDNLTTSQCIFYIRTSSDGAKGYCSNYTHRPSVCRSFAVAASKDKHGKKTPSICKEIRDFYPKHQQIIDLENAPVIGDYARKIASLDGSLGTMLYPINAALKMALEKVLFLSQFS